MRKNGGPSVEEKCWGPCAPPPATEDDACKNTLN